MSNDEIEDIAEAISGMEPRRRSTLAFRLGIGCARRSNAQCAAEMGVSLDRWRQLRNHARWMLCGRLRDLYMKRGNSDDEACDMAGVVWRKALAELSRRERK